MQHLNKILQDYRKLLRLYNDGTVFTSFDTETTGISPSDSRIIEIGAVKFNKDGIICRWNELINPQKDIPPFIIQLTHITPQMLENKKDISFYLPDFLELIKDTVLIAHNAQFDLNFINAECALCGLPPTNNKTIDTLRLSRWAYPKSERHKLEFLADALKLDKGSSHRALDDADTCRQLFLKILEDTKDVQKL